MRFAKGPEGIGRAFFCTTVGHEMVILHAFIKKTEKTPRKELDLARRRLRKYVMKTHDEMVTEWQEDPYSATPMRP